MIRIVNINLFALIIFITQGVVAAGLNSPAIEPIRLNQLLTGQKPPLVVDVRSPDEYSAGHIPNSVNIPVPLIAKRLGEMGNVSDLVLYCNDSRLTRVAEQMLLRGGVKGFFHLEGGLNGWQEAGLELENSLPE